MQYSSTGEKDSADGTSSTTSKRHDEFLQSMTFASGGTNGIDNGGLCGCDDCGPLSDEVPPTIRDAVKEHLRKRKMEQYNRQILLFDGSKRLYIRQNRELVKREGGFSLWRLDMPLDGGDPIVEFRANHRIMFIKQLNKASKVYSIGKGIIGSAAEEGSRKVISWKQGSAYLLPHLEGIACGWIQKHAIESESNENSASPKCSNISDICDVIIYTLKVSQDTLSTWTVGCDFPADVSSWVRKSHELFHRCLVIDGSKNEYSLGGIELSDDEASLMSVIIELAGGRT